MTSAHIEIDGNTAKLVSSAGTTLCEAKWRTLKLRGIGKPDYSPIYRARRKLQRYASQHRIWITDKSETKTGNLE